MDSNNYEKRLTKDRTRRRHLRQSDRDKLNMPNIVKQALTGDHDTILVNNSGLALQTENNPMPSDCENPLSILNRAPMRSTPRCKCGALSGSDYVLAQCNLCGTCCRYRPVEEYIEEYLDKSLEINIPTTIIENTIEGEDMSKPTLFEKSEQDKTVINIHQPKSEGLSAVAYIIGAVVVGAGVFAAAWYLKR